MPIGLQGEDLDKKATYTPTTNSIKCDLLLIFIIQGSI